MNPPVQRISARLLRPLVIGLRLAGRDVDALLQQAGIVPDALNEANAWVSFESAMNLWAAAERSGLPDMGFRLVEGIDFSLFAHLSSVTDYLLVQLIVTSSDLADAIHQFERYAAISFGDLKFEVLREAEGTTIRLPVPGVLPREFVNFVVSFPMRALLQTAAKPVACTDIYLPYDRPPSLEMHQKVLNGIRFHFNADSAGFRLAASDLTVALIGERPELSRQLRTRGDAMLAEYAQHSSLAVQVRALLGSESKFRGATAESVAERLGLSVRTLARRLEQEGTSYQSLVDEMRSSLARELLQDARLSVAEVAVELGFSDATALQRAFRRWFGTTPGQFRASLKPR